MNTLTLNGSWVNEDVISQNSLVDNSSAFVEKVNNGNYAVLYADTYPVRAYEVDGSEGGWSYRPVWVNTPIDENYGGITTGADTAFWGIFNDTLTDAQIEQLIHCINYLYSPVGYNNFAWGPASAGLFTVDADGTCTFADEELAANVLKGEGTEAAEKYGIMCSGADVFTTKPGSAVCSKLLNARYTLANKSERLASSAYTYYCPGILPGMSLKENVDIVNKNSHVYQFGASFEGLQEFWKSRAGFEDQMKKVMAATPENFETAYQALLQFADEHYLNQESIQVFNDAFVEANRDKLIEMGVIE